MQHEGELRSDLDFLMDILRSNPATRFTISKLHVHTGLPVPFVKKWVGVLAERGHLRFFYNIPDHEFSWAREGVPCNGNGGHEYSAPVEAAPAHFGQLPQIFHPRAVQNISGPGAQNLRQYSRGEIGVLLEDIKKALGAAKRMDARVCALKKSHMTDLAALGIARHDLRQKKRELAHLLSEAKRLRG